MDSAAAGDFLLAIATIFSQKKKKFEQTNIYLFD